MEPKELGERIRQLRTSRGKTLTEIALEIGVSQGQFSKYEHGHHSLSFDKLVRICNYFGVTPNDLLDYETRIQEDEFSPEVIDELLSKAMGLRLGIGEDRRVIEAIQTYEKAEKIIFSDELLPFMKYEGSFGTDLPLLWTNGAEAFGKEKNPDELTDRVVSMCKVKIELANIHEQIEQQQEAIRHYSDFHSLIRNCYPGFGDRRWVDVSKDSGGHGSYFALFRQAIFDFSRLISHKDPEEALNCMVGLAITPFYLYTMTGGKLFHPSFYENVATDIWHVHKVKALDLRKLRASQYQGIFYKRGNYERGNEFIKEANESVDNVFLHDNILGEVYERPFDEFGIRLKRKKTSDAKTHAPLEEWARDDAELEYAVKKSLRTAIVGYNSEAETYRKVIDKDHEELKTLVEGLREKLELINSDGLDVYLDKLEEDCLGRKREYKERWERRRENQPQKLLDS